MQAYQTRQKKLPGKRYAELRTSAALELIRYSRHEPTTKMNPQRPHELLHRFAGLTKEGEKFYVQIKENKRTNRKHLISCFPDHDYR